MNSITIMLPYYINAGMLRLQLDTLKAYPPEIKRHLHLIVVDDGSPTSPAFHDEIGFPYQLYRMKVDIRWNQDACRNVGAHHAETDWLLFTDIDHLLPQRTISALVRGKFDQRKLYTFARHFDYPNLTPVVKNGKARPHPNSWFLTRDLYWRIGGYDEFYAGKYGTDGDFRERAEAIAGPQVSLPLPLFRVLRHVIPDAATTTYGRKEPQDAVVPEMRATRRAERDADPTWRPLNLSFPYERIA